MEPNTDRYLQRWGFLDVESGGLAGGGGHNGGSQRQGGFIDPALVLPGATARSGVVLGR